MQASDTNDVSPLWYSWQTSTKDHKFSTTKIHIYLHFKMFTISFEDKVLSVNIFLLNHIIVITASTQLQQHD